MLGLAFEPQHPNSPWVMHVFFSTRDTGSGLGAGTILGGCLDLPPVKDTDLGCAKVTQGWGGRTAGGWVSGDSVRPWAGAEGAGWCVVMTRPWLGLKAAAEAVWVATAGDLLAPANFCGCRKAGGAGGVRAVAGGGASGTAGAAGGGAGLGASTGMANTGWKGCGAPGGDAGGPKSVGGRKGSPGWGVPSQPGLSAGSRAAAAGDAMRLSGRLTVGRGTVGRMLSCGGRRRE